MAAFSDKLRKDTNLIWSRILSHPYITELFSALLPLKKFKFYITQDYPFLIQYARCLGIATAKVQDLNTMRRFASLLNTSLSIEINMLKSLGMKLGISSRELEDAVEAPTTMAYTHHLLYTSYSSSVGEALAAMLPCMWSYQQIGEQLNKSEEIKKHPLFFEWSSTYCTLEYIDLVNWYKTLVNELGSSASNAERRRMKRHFHLSSRYEYMFWDMAYKQEQWPVS